MIRLRIIKTHSQDERKMLHFASDFCEVAFFTNKKSRNMHAKIDFLSMHENAGNQYKASQAHTQIESVIGYTNDLKPTSNRPTLYERENLNLQVNL